MRKPLALLALTGLIALAACHKKAEEPVPMENNVAEFNDTEPQQPVEAPPVLEPETPSTNNSAAPAPPPPPKVSQDQQTLDDADATGLTSKLPDDYDAGGNHSSAAQ